MVEGELKQSSPGKEFTKRVVHEIKKAGVWRTDCGRDCLHLDYGDGLSLTFSMGDHEAQAVLTTLGQRKGAPVDDAHRALAALLRAFDLEVREVKLGPNDEGVQMKLRTPAGKAGSSKPRPNLSGVPAAGAASGRVVVLPACADRLARSKPGAGRRVVGDTGLEPVTSAM